MGSWPSKRGTSNFICGLEIVCGNGVFGVLGEVGLTVRLARFSRIKSILLFIVV